MIQVVIERRDNGYVVSVEGDGMRGVPNSAFVCKTFKELIGRLDAIYSFNIEKYESKGVST